MEDNKKLLRFLRISGFSLLLAFSLTSCRDYGLEEYSFLNKLDNDVELLLYMSNDVFDGKVSSNYIIPSGDFVKFITLKPVDRDGFGQNYFCNQLDSVKLKMVGVNEFVAIWRFGKEPEYLYGYRMKWNFFCEWWEIIQHGGSHAEYRYWLELAEE